MKSSKKAGKFFLMLYRWIIISVICQMLILLFFNNVYLVRRSNAGKNAKLSTTDESSKKDQKTVNVKIPDGASDVRVSFDGSYISYLNSGKLEIMSVEKKSVVKTIDGQGQELAVYYWFTERNMIIYSFKTPETKSGLVKLETYDVDNEQEHVYEKLITNVPKGSKVEELELSPKTNVVYVKVKTGESQAVVYRYDVQGDLYYIMETNVATTFRTTYLSDNLLYVKSGNKLNIRGWVSGSTRTESFDQPIAVLGGDYDDNVYVGEKDGEGKVSAVWFGKYNEKPSESWKKITLKKTVPEKNIIVTRGESVYAVDETECLMHDLKNDMSIPYKGKFIQVEDEFYATIDGNTVSINPMKK